MKVKIMFFLQFFLICSTFAQKKEIYLNDDLVQITESQFYETNDPYRFHNIQFELDSSIVHVKYQRVKKGKISMALKDSIRTELSTLSNTSIPKHHIIIINYYHQLDACNKTSDKYYLRSKYKKYLKKISRFEDVSQFFMYKSPEGISKYGKQLKWIEDKHDIVKKTFLPIPYPCGSYVLIDENGNYYLQKGEYNIEQIISLINQRTTTFSN